MQRSPCVLRSPELSDAPDVILEVIQTQAGVQTWCVVLGPLHGDEDDKQFLLWA